MPMARHDSTTESPRREAGRLWVRLSLEILDRASIAHAGACLNTSRRVLLDVARTVLWISLGKGWVTAQF